MTHPDIPAAEIDALAFAAASSAGSPHENALISLLRRLAPEHETLVRLDALAREHGFFLAGSTDRIAEPTTLHGYELALEYLKADETLDRDSRAQALHLLAKRCRATLWNNRERGAEIAVRIEAAIDPDADRARGMDALAQAGRLQAVR